MLISIKSFMLNIKDYNKKYDYLWFLLIPILNINYLITGRLYKVGYDISLNLDKIIPVIPFFIIPYVFWYLYIPIGLLSFLFVDRLKYIKVFIAIFTGMITCYIIYLFFPTEYVRPVISDTGIFNRLILAIYSNDKPFNCFPSIHVVNTYLIMRFTKYNKSKIFFFYTQITGILIILSTLFIKQHYILDVVSAIILVEIIIMLVDLLKLTSLQAILDLPRRFILRKKSKITIEDTENILE